MASYLITGGTGFLGRHLIGQLRAAGDQSVVQVQDMARWDAWSWTAASGAQPWPVPLAQADQVAVPDGPPSLPTLPPVDGIFHLAGVVHHSRRPHHDMWAVNVEATLAMVRLAHRLKVRLVWVSTSGTVGCSTDRLAAPDEHAPLAEDMVAKWPYYYSKVVAEKEAGALARQLGVSLVILRPPVLLGPLDHRLRSTGMVARFMAGQPPLVPTGSMPYVDVRDVAAASMAAMRRQRPQPAYHLPGHHLPLRDFFAQLGTLCGRPPPRYVISSRLLLQLGRWDARLSGWARRGRWLPLPDEVVLEMGACHWGLSSRYAHELSFHPRPSLSTLADTVAWLRQHDPRCRPQAS